MRKMQICDYFIVIAFIFSLSAMGADQSSSTTLSSLPAAAQARISAALGKDNPGYSIKAVTSGFETINAGQKLVTRFTSEGVEVRNGTARWGLALGGYGYGNALTTAKTAAPQATANRVEYQRGELTEWYVNGPVGLEQGFTLNHPPEKANDQPLTIALAVSGNMRMTVDEGHASVKLREREGNSELRYTGLTATDANGKELRAWLDVQGKQLLLKVDAARARYPVVVDPWVQLAKLTISEGGPASSVAINGDTVVVGVPSSGAAAGAAYVFVKPASGWLDMAETAKLTASNGLPWSYFGNSVAISGDTVVIGSWWEDIGDNQNQGEAYVFVKPAGGWVNMTETAKLTESDGKIWDYFGYCVAISGNTIVVGPDGGGQRGAYVFVRPPGGWTDMTETAKLEAEDYMRNVSIAGDTIVAGGGLYSAVYLFVRPRRGWVTSTETAKLTASGGTSADKLGFSVSIHGDTVVAGAPNATVGSHSAQGAAYVFVKPADSWADMTETAKLTARDGMAGDDFGAFVSFGGYRAVIGAPGADIGENIDQGAVYVFATPKSGWKTTKAFNAKLTVRDGAAGDAFGSAVSVSHGVVVGAAPSNTQGAAYVFAR